MLAPRGALDRQACRYRQSRTGRAWPTPSPQSGPPCGARISVTSLASGDEARNLYLHPRPHGRAEARLLDEGAFDARRLGAADRADEGARVLEQRLLGEARLADPGLDHAGLLGAILDLAALRGLDRLGDVGRDGAEPGVRHQAARAQDLAEPADDRHHVGRGDAAI